MTREEFRDYVGVLRLQNEISYYGYSKLVNEIDTLEQESKIGHWISNNGYIWCSECNFRNSKRPNFCENCGAKMESEE